MSPVDPGSRPPLSGVGIRNPYEFTGSALTYYAERLLRAGAALFLFDARALADVDDARVVRELCRAFGVPFFVWGDPGVAAACGADGELVEAGADPAACGAGVSARPIAGVLFAAESRDEAPGLPEGIEFVALGPIDAACADEWANGLRRTAALGKRGGRPLLLIGEFNAAQCAALIAAGADGVVVGSAVMAAEDPVRSLAALLAVCSSS